MAEKGKGKELSEVLEQLEGMMPKEKVENTEVKEDNVDCKLFLKGKPHNLRNAIDVILDNMIVRKNGSIDHANTPTYILTLMIEKVKNP